MNTPKDWNDAHRQGENALEIANAVPSQSVSVRQRQSRAIPPAPWHERVITAAALRHKTFPPIACVVPNLIPDGLSMLAGRPKIGIVDSNRPEQSLRHGLRHAQLVGLAAVMM